jgi:hypothetical protein
VYGSALFSPCGRYRYLLGRRWGAGRTVLWIMLNPSTADDQRDDPTIRRCIGFSRAWGFGAMRAVNLYALRATDPADLRAHPEPVGPDTDRHIARAAAGANIIVAAWGAFPLAKARAAPVLDLIARPVRCLGLTASGAPRHPLYVPRTAQPRAFAAPALMP